MNNKHTSLWFRLITVAVLGCLVFVGAACQSAATIDNLKQAHDVQGLIKLLVDPTQKRYDQKRAAETLGELGNPAAVEPLIQVLQTWVADGSNKLDEVGAAAQALGKLGDARAVEPLITALQTKKWERTTRQEIIFALGTLHDSRAIIPLLQKIPDKRDADKSSPEIGIYDDVLSALYTMGEAAFAPLTKELPNLRETCLRHKAATFAVSQSTNPTARAVLETELKAAGKCSKRNAAEALYMFFKRDIDKLLPYLKSKATVVIYTEVIHVGRAGTESALIAALGQYGDKEMAQYYLNSGNAQLAAAAKAWARKHGFNIMNLPGNDSPTWGQ